MAPLRSLVEDEDRYNKSFQLFLERSSEHQCMQDFIRSVLPDVLAGIGRGKTHVSVVGVGSGTGKMDVEMLSQLHRRLPGVTVDNEVVEPSSEMMHKYKALVSDTRDLDYVNFIWNKMTACEFQKRWKENKLEKKIDFIHMIQMLYYVSDPEATVSFFHSLLSENGKLIIILVSGQSGWDKLWRTFAPRLCIPSVSQCLTARDVKSFLDDKGVQYKSYELPSHMDITECFAEGDERGELLLDFLTEVKDFRENAPAELEEGVMSLLRHPECSTEVDGRVLFNNNLTVLVIDHKVLGD
ncbi:histamine N-methyltransferase [Denticeps clupeoides]|uniref:Histamine N-methyltransferase n=1 Tax=Denticeps clupeoides TaxID=299321 RepID=A0AAY4EJU9_9TELE|nr:histamine N-methyltransferase [Denticeps clupeoides]XP_028846569.1 histamine N-methyltransferase [Denticeps clupeoides]